MATTPLTLEQKIAQAQEAYHLLLTGRSARVVVDQNGERVEFTAANRASLYSYIRELEAQLPSAPTVPTRYGPATFTF
jgi:hypothetical protein